MNKERIIKELNLKPFGNKGWMRSDECDCSICEKSDKLGILFVKNSGIVKCMRCGEATSLFNYLIQIKRSDLIEGFSAPIEDILKTFQEEDDIIIKEDIKVALPRKFKRIYYDDYLDSRDFTTAQYNLFKVGKTETFGLKDHLIFPIYMDNELVAWLGRSRLSKEWHKQNLKEHKLKNSKLVLRYKNSPDVNFDEIVGGYDEIIKGKTKRVIVVEGLFDKANVDRLLDLYLSDEVKCVFSFGKNLSFHQMNKILEKGVEELVIMFDPDAINEIVKYGMKYLKKFKSVLCVKLKDRDPGDLNKIEIDTFLNNLYSPLNLHFSNLKKIE